MAKKIAAINGSGMCFSYDYDGEDLPVLNNIDITVKKGELVVILGKNGCGKSTLLKQFNGILQLKSGSLCVNNFNISKYNESEIWRLRQHCGMVFQNPDNQFVSSVVEEDVAFGLENYQVPRHEIASKVKEALSLVGMEGYEKRSPHSLSGGQKQRIALAGILALDPDIILFDEVTSMLDPESRDEILAAISSLHKERKKTIILITHYVDEAIIADTVYLMHEGNFLSYGTAFDILTDTKLLDKAGLLPPLPVQAYYDLKSAGIILNKCPLTKEGLVKELCQLN